MRQGLDIRNSSQFKTHRANNRFESSFFSLSLSLFLLFRPGTSDDGPGIIKGLMMRRASTPRTLDSRSVNATANSGEKGRD